VIVGDAAIDDPDHGGKCNREGIGSGIVCGIGISNGIASDDSSVNEIWTRMVSDAAIDDPDPDPDPEAWTNGGKYHREGIGIWIASFSAKQSPGATGIETCADGIASYP